MRTKTNLLAALLAVGLSSCVVVDGRRGQASGGFEVGSDFVESIGYVTHAEAEFPIHKKITLTGRLLYYGYEWESEDFDEEEEGWGSGVGGEFRFYPKQAMDGFYVGAGFGVFPFADWEFRDTGVVTAEGDDTAITAYGSLGFCIRAGEKFAITPTIILGTYESDSPQSGFYGGGGVRFSVSF